MTLTKRDAEDLSEYLNENGVSSTFIHCGLNTQERADALKALQSGEVSCLVGVNLLREGLDLPQVSLVAILNADSEVCGLCYWLSGCQCMRAQLTQYAVRCRDSFVQRRLFFKQWAVLRGIFRGQQFSMLTE